MVKFFQVSDPDVSALNVIKHGDPIAYLSFGPGPVGSTPTVVCLGRRVAEEIEAMDRRESRLTVENMIEVGGLDLKE